MRISKSVQKTIRADGTEDANSLAFLLFGIVATFFICKSFQMVAGILYHLDETDNIFYQIFLSPKSLLDTLNSCVNFIFYCVYGTNFRAELGALWTRIRSNVCPVRTKSEEMGSENENEGNTSSQGTNDGTTL